MKNEKAKHTPGPWEISGGTNKKGELYIWRKARPGIIDGGAIAAVLHHYAPAELAANAALIAAAPDMAARIKKLEEVNADLRAALERYVDDFARFESPAQLEKKPGREIYQQALAAIAKAKGE